MMMMWTSGAGHFRIGRSVIKVKVAFIYWSRRRGIHYISARSSIVVYIKVEEEVKKNDLSWRR